MPERKDARETCCVCRARPAMLNAAGTWICSTCLWSHIPVHNLGLLGEDMRSLMYTIDTLRNKVEQEMWDDAEETLTGLQNVVAAMKKGMPEQRDGQ